MPFIQRGELKLFQFELLMQPDIVQGIFTRRGGVSPHPWRSLNLGGTVGDTRTNVIENRRRIFDLMQRPVESIFDTWQVHSDRVVCVDQPRPLESQPIQADAILTNDPRITLFMRFADCVPIFFYDPVKRVIGIAHAGWVGTIKRIAEQVVRTMARRYGCCPTDIRAGIGPSIGVDHYLVGQDVIAATNAVFGEQVNQLLMERDGKMHLDLWAANRLSLQTAGVRKVETAGVCTACNQDDWYSHRGEMGKTGRFGAILALRG